MSPTVPVLRKNRQFARNLLIKESFHAEIEFTIGMENAQFCKYLVNITGRNFLSHESQFYIL